MVAGSESDILAEGLSRRDGPGLICTSVQAKQGNMRILGLATDADGWFVLLIKQYNCFLSAVKIQTSRETRSRCKKDPDFGLERATSPGVHGT